jgi:hypothetical protein
VARKLELHRCSEVECKEDLGDMPVIHFVTICLPLLFLFIVQCASFFICIVYYLQY